MSMKLEEMFSEIQQQGINTNKNVSLGGTLAVTGATTLSGGLVGIKPAVTASGGVTRTLTAANTGSINLFDSAAGITYTLPAPSVGLIYDFVWTVSQTSSNHIVITDAGTTFIVGGNATFSATDVTPSATLGPKFFAANGTTHIKFTSNATTLGSAIGSWLRFICVSSTLWFANGVIDSPSGTIATPWST